MTMTYGELTNQITYYLDLYPHMGVALEATLEDVEGDGQLAKEVRSAMEAIYEGKTDFSVVAVWADKTGSRDLEKLAVLLEEATTKGIDIGVHTRSLQAPKPAPVKEAKPKRNFNRKRNAK